MSEREKLISYVNTYMWNPEKMVYIVLFAKQKERHRHREQANGRQGGQRGGMDCKTEIDIYTPLILCIKEMPNESLLYCGDLSSELRGDLLGNSKRRGQVCMSNRSTLPYSRDYCNTVRHCTPIKADSKSPEWYAKPAETSKADGGHLSPSPVKQRDASP